MGCNKTDQGDIQATRHSCVCGVKQHHTNNFSHFQTLQFHADTHSLLARTRPTCFYSYIFIWQRLSHLMLRAMALTPLPISTELRRMTSPPQSGHAGSTSVMFMVRHFLHTHPPHAFNFLTCIWWSIGAVFLQFVRNVFAVTEAGHSLPISTCSGHATALHFPLP